MREVLKQNGVAVIDLSELTPIERWEELRRVPEDLEDLSKIEVPEYLDTDRLKAFIREHHATQRVVAGILYKETYGIIPSWQNPQEKWLDIGSRAKDSTGHLYARLEGLSDKFLGIAGRRNVPGGLFNYNFQLSLPLTMSDWSLRLESDYPEELEIAAHSEAGGLTQDYSSFAGNGDPRLVVQLIKEAALAMSEELEGVQRRKLEIERLGQRATEAAVTQLA